MDRIHKLTLLADAAKYDSSCASSGATRAAQAGGLGHATGAGICHSYTPDGRCVSLLKILLTNFCIYDCRYCVNRISSDVPRARFSVGEVVELTLDFYRRNYIEGLFLSSGIIQSPDYTMEQLVAVARTLRLDHRFGGYIHLKLIPGAAAALTTDAARWADRVSVNVELAVETQLVKLAPEKRHAVIETSMQQVRDGAAAAVANGPSRTPAPRFAPAGQSTQMIVGAGGESDRDILAKSSQLYSGYGLRRVYYSAFSPFPGADRDLPPAAPPLMREHRLYQADWLFRFYGFDVEELTTTATPDLDLRADPKLTWALRHREAFPVDIHRAPREQLLRVPGFGRRTVARLLKIRKHHRVDDHDLRRLGVQMGKARPFIVTASGGPSTPSSTARRTTRPLRTARRRLMRVRFRPTLAGWRAAARPHLAARTPAPLLQWESSDTAQPGLDLDGPSTSPPPGEIRIPAAFLELAKAVALHRSPSRWSDLYAVALRLVSGETHLLDLESDPAVLRLNRMAQQVRRDIHKMHAFVRFRCLTVDGIDRYVAWHRPDHFIVRAAASFFVDRFASMQWSILTPDACAHWEGTRLRFTPGVDAPPDIDDPTEEAWRAYYGAIFNPARLNLRAMRAEMPARHWATLPEVSMLPALIAGAGPRVARMLEDGSAGERRAAPPDTSDLARLRQAAVSCTACDLHARATQVVFGAGSRGARIMLIGEQPGDHEDVAGAPFVGPAGQVLARVLARIGIPRDALYLTNVVKHFKWEPRGKRRIHQTPRLTEIRACRPWLDAELSAVAPRIIVCLGATAAKALLGPQFQRLKALGTTHATPWSTPLIATYHPSAVLRAETVEHAADIEARLEADLRRAHDCSRPD